MNLNFLDRVILTLLAGGLLGFAAGWLSKRWEEHERRRRRVEVTVRRAWLLVYPGREPEPVELELACLALHAPDELAAAQYLESAGWTDPRLTAAALRMAYRELVDIRRPLADAERGLL